MRWEERTAYRLVNLMENGETIIEVGGGGKDRAAVEEKKKIRIAEQN